MRILLLFLVISFCSGCAVLFGNIKPSAKKSDDYKVLDLSQLSSTWVLISNSEDLSNPESLDTSDIAYQSKKDSSIISLNSICQNSHNKISNMEYFSNQLFHGIINQRQKNIRPLKVSGTSAIETTLTGELNKKTVKLRAIIIKQKECIFDLLYISTPKSFQTNEKVFEKFSNSLKL